LFHCFDYLAWTTRSVRRISSRAEAGRVGSPRCRKISTSQVELRQRAAFLTAAAKSIGIVKIGSTEADSNDADASIKVIAGETRVGELMLDGGCWMLDVAVE